MPERGVSTEAAAYTHWTTRDGRRIAVTQMTDDHLRNTIKHLEVRECQAEINTVFYGEMYERTDSLCDEIEMNDSIDSLIFCEEWLEVLRAEVARRDGARRGGGGE